MWTRTHARTHGRTLAQPYGSNHAAVAQWCQWLSYEKLASTAVLHVCACSRSSSFSSSSKLKQIDNSGYASVGNLPILAAAATRHIKTRLFPGNRICSCWINLSSKCVFHFESKSEWRGRRRNKPWMWADSLSEASFVNNLRWVSRRCICRKPGWRAGRCRTGRESLESAEEESTRQDVTRSRAANTALGGRAAVNHVWGHL